MIPRIAADALVVFHLAFIVFVVVGGFFAWRWRWMPWLHVPVALWGATVELTGWLCPLTPWEVALRRQAGQAGYEGSFVEQYILPIVYPGALTPQIQIGLGIAVIAINVVAYWGYYRRRAAR
jgi:hypothetical protein